MPSKIRKLTDIYFPIYGITNDYIKTWTEYNVTFVKTHSGTYILDNKNMLGETLGVRRAKIAKNKYIFRAVVFNVTQLIKSKYKTFMDTTGAIFKYKKDTFVPLKYYKVASVEELGDTGCVLKFRGINYPIKVNYRLAYSIQCIGILHTSLGYILYEYSDKLKADTRRKI